MLDNHVRIGMEVTYKGLKHRVNRKADNGSYMLSIGDSYTYAFPNEFEPFPIPTTFQNRTEEINEIIRKEKEMIKKEKEKAILSTINAPKHYDNTNGSLYLFAEQNDLNAWEFEIIKRTVRCRKKGEFISDIKKTIDVLELYLKEQGHLYENQVEKLN
jgi:hypothetical protein